MAVDIRKPLRRLLPHLLKAQEENLNEADTVFRLVKFFEDVLGYNALEEVTGEKEVKDKFVDLAIKVDGVVRLLVEAKAAGVDLKNKHADQAYQYAATGNIPWVLLSNGVHWKLYHLTFEKGIEPELAFDVDLASDDSIEKAGGLLGLLHRKSIRKGDLDDYWDHATALRPESIAKALFTEGVLRLIRREIRKRQRRSVDDEDLARAIHAMFSPEAREQIGPMKIYRKEKLAKPAKPKEAGAMLSAPPIAASTPPTQVPTATPATPEGTASDNKVG